MITNNKQLPITRCKNSQDIEAHSIKAFVSHLVLNKNPVFRQRFVAYVRDVLCDSCFLYYGMLSGHDSLFDGSGLRCTRHEDNGHQTSAKFRFATAAMAAVVAPPLAPRSFYR